MLTGLPSNRENRDSLPIPLHCLVHCSSAIEFGNKCPAVGTTGRLYDQGLKLTYRHPTRHADPQASDVRFVKTDVSQSYAERRSVGVRTGRCRLLDYVLDVEEERADDRAAQAEEREAIQPTGVAAG